MSLKISFFASFSPWIIFLVLMITAIGGNLIPFGISLFAFVMLAWLFSVGLALQEKLPARFDVSTRWFKILLAYVFFYVMLTNLFVNIELFYVIPFHLLAVYGMFYALYFVSRSLVTAEEKQSLRFDRYIGTLFLFWFFPIGIWFVQPRVRRILKNIKK